MDSKTFFDNFETIANAPGGIARLRELILDLAVRGELVFSDRRDWKASTLGEAVEIIRGVTFPASAKQRVSGKGLIPCLRTTNVQLEVDWDDLLYISEEFVRKESQYVQMDDVLISMANSRELVGKVALVRRDDIRCTLGGFIAAIRCGETILPRFLMALLRVPSAREKLIDSSTQTTNIANISLGRLNPFELTLPPIIEQEEIVAKVDELMALCDELEIAQDRRDSIRTDARKSAINSISTANTSEELNDAWKRISNNWTTIADTPESIASLRSLILDLAVRGSFDSSEGDADQALIPVELEKLKLDKDKLWALPTALPEPVRSWSRVPMARLGQWGSGGTPTASRKEYYQNGTIPWAVIGDLNNSVMLITESLITEKAFQSSSTKIIPIGAVLVAMYGASIGKTAINGIKCCTNQAIAHCVVDEDVIFPEYMFLVIKSLKNHLIEMGKGAAQPNISQTVLKHLVIDIPSLRLQKKVLERTDELLDLCDQIESSLIAKNNLGKAMAKTLTRTVVA